VMRFAATAWCSIGGIAMLKCRRYVLVSFLAELDGLLYSLVL
jgi:hypothetical protein